MVIITGDLVRERERVNFWWALGVDGWICDVAKDKRYMIKESEKPKSKKLNYKVTVTPNAHALYTMMSQSS